MLKKFLIIFLILVLASLFVTYLINSFLPKKIEAKLIHFFKENFHTKAEIGEIRAGFKGVSLSDIYLYRIGENAPYLTIERLDVFPFYPSLGHQKIPRKAGSRYSGKIIVSLDVHKPVYKLKRNKDGSFDMPEMKSKESGKNGDSPFLIKSIAIGEGKVDFKDEMVNFHKTFSDINLKASFSLFPKINPARPLTPFRDKSLNGVSRLFSNGINFRLSFADKIAIIGKYEFKNKTTQAAANLKNIELDEFAPYFSDFTDIKGYIKNAGLKIEGSGDWKISGKINTENISIVKNGIRFSGSMNLRPNFTLRDKEFGYIIDGELKDGNVSNLPSIDTLSNINAGFHLDKTDLTIPSITTNLGDNHIEGRGKLNFATAKFSILSKTSTSVQKIIHTLECLSPHTPPFMKRVEYGGGTGSIDLKSIIRGNIQQKKFIYQLDYDIKDGNFKDAENIKAKGFLKKDTFVIEDGEFSYNKIPIKLKSEVNNFSSPTIWLVINGGGVNIQTEANYKQKKLIIKSFTMDTENSKIYSSGYINTQEKSQVDIKGGGSLQLEDALNVINTFHLDYPQAVKLDPHGIINTKFEINGSLPLNNLRIKFAGSSAEIKVYNIVGKEVKIDLYKDKKEFVVSPFQALMASGEIDFRAKFDYQKNKKTINCVVNNLDLSRIKEEFAMDNKNIKNLAGRLFLEIYLENNAIADWNKLDGEGKIIIKDGNIWELNLIRGLGEFLFIPDFEEIRFSDAYTDLVFKDEEVIFENLGLESLQMNIKGGGRINLKGDINFLLFPEFNPLLVSSSESLKRIITGFLGKSGLTVEIKGNMKNPKYKIRPSISLPVKELQNIFKGLL